MATTVAMVRATNGSPRNPNTGCTEARAGTTFAMEFRIMRTSGIKIIPTIVPNFGSFDSSKSSWLAMCSGTGISYLFPQIVPHMGPATIMAKIPHTIPTIMTQPRSTPSMVATSTGPGVGGINAWPTARPASRGMA